MDARKSTIPVIRTKLHRPPLPRDLVRRDALHDWLDDGGHQPLILVSAPAGYGKSVFVSQWLESRAGPSAWVSLDKTDGDLRAFLSYVVAAVHTVFPDACSGTLAQLGARVLAPLPVLAGSLINDFEELDEPIVLVLDDYHRINEPVVHELVNQLLMHPSARLQLVVISRYDPPLALGALRAHSNVTEVRMQDLRFTLAETGAFLEQATGERFSSTALERVYQSTEGWVAGLRLTALAVQHRPDAEAYLGQLDGNVRDIQDFLVQEVLSQQLPATVDGLCRTSILERFCAPLCEVLGADLGDKDTNHLDGLTFIRLLEDSGLFSVALDGSGEWYRYHHLFRELMQRQLEAKHTQSEIAALHRRAAAWLEEQGCLEEAIHHALQADGAEEAGRLMVRHRNDILNQEQWYGLDRWLHQLPAKTIEYDPELLMLQAWLLQNHGRYSEAFSMLDRIEELINSGQSSPATERLCGAVHALRSQQRYLEGQGERAVQHADKALILLTPDCLSERAYAVMFGCGGHQMCGDIDRARNVIRGHLADISLPLGTFQVRMEIVLGFILWMAADLPSLRSAADRFRELAEKLGLAEGLEFVSYFFGIVDYQLNSLAQAETFLAPVVAAHRIPNLEFYCQSAFALASVYQASGRAEKARDTVTSLYEYLLQVENRSQLLLAQAYRADLAIRQGRISEGLEWARGFDPEPFEQNYRFFEPRITLAKALIAEGEKTSLESAAVLLQRLEAFYTGIHNIRLLIEVLALQALLSDAQGDESTARDLLTRAVGLAQPGGFIRLFVDLGPGLARLLNGLNLDAEGLRYVGQILSAFSGDGKTQTVKGPDHALTRREVEILGLLADELSNNQIADQLCISPATVKRHTENIYQKLGVHGRRKAVAKAGELSMIHTG
jgi:LuxR family maltose regulon positive regulatory protein